MPTWAEIRLLIDELPEPYRGLANRLYLEAEETVVAYPDSAWSVLYELHQCVQGIEWDRANGGISDERARFYGH